MSKSARRSSDDEQSVVKKSRVAGNYVIPDDWPELEGDIDLSVHDLPHDSANTEWWYINGHVKNADGDEYSIHVAFFRVATGRKDENGELEHLHSMTANIIDCKNKFAHFFSYLDPTTPSVIKYQLENGTYHLDKRLSEAMYEVVSRGSCPLPDFMFDEPAKVSRSEIFFDYTKGNTFKRLPNGDYHVTVNCEEKKLAFDVVLTPKKPVIRQGGNGVVQVGIRQETMFYYFIPRNDLVGSLTVDGVKMDIKGDGWYDHEFGGGVTKNVYRPSDEDESVNKGVAQKPAEKDESFAWNWFSMQLDNGYDITATNLVDILTQKVTDNFLILIDPKGERLECRDMTVSHEDDWISVRSGNIYPLTWKIEVPSAELTLDLKAVIANQEVFTLISRPAYWEGRLEVTGTFKGQPITGRALLERHGFEEIDSLDYFFKKISKVVRQEIADVIPRHPNFQQMTNLLANDDNLHYMDGVNQQVLEKVIINPLRDVVDRGGKSWRSYALLLCIDAVGGFSFKYQHWLAMPELMHVGSLIIDDIQDKSETRRGQPSCHIKYGEPLAINAGTASYFLAMHLLQSRTPDLSDASRVMLYDLYFLTLRAGHCGQGFDINGLEYLMDNAVENGETEELLKGVVCTHRLKSAVPAGNLARMGAHVGGGTPEQGEALGHYFESIGIAFQIIDDVLNLRGFVGNTKVRGEDLHEGKITYPVARAMGKLSKEQRKEFWDTLKTKPDYDVVEKLIQMIEAPEINALNDSIKDASDMVEDAFQKLCPTIPDSYYKIMLRAFGKYVLDRHY